jgi:multidrug efflux system membrane fusion protein
MIATLTLGEAPAPKNLLVIPLGAVVRSPLNPDGFAVFVVADEGGKSIARIRSVELEEQPLGNRIGVKSGLSLNDRVIATGASLVKDGEQVQVIF